MLVLEVLPYFFFFNLIIYQCQELLFLKPRQSPDLTFFLHGPRESSCFSFLIKATPTFSLPWRAGEKEAASPGLCFLAVLENKPRSFGVLSWRYEKLIGMQKEVYIILRPYKGLRITVSSQKIPLLSCWVVSWSCCFLLLLLWAPPMTPPTKH